MLRAVLAALAVLASASGAPATAATPAVAFRSVAQDDGAERAAKTAGTRVVRSARAWRTVWADLHSGSRPVPPRPAVDFARHALVVVAAGRRPTGGYAIRVTSVRRRDGRVVVRAQERAPGQGCLAAQVETAPYEVIRIGRTSRRVTSVRRQVAVDC